MAKDGSARPADEPRDASGIVDRGNTGNAFERRDHSGAGAVTDENSNAAPADRGPLARGGAADTDFAESDENFPAVESGPPDGFAPLDNATDSGGYTDSNVGGRHMSGTWGLGGTGHGRGTDLAGGADVGGESGTSPGSYGSGGSSGQ